MCSSISTILQLAVRAKRNSVSHLLLDVKSDQSPFSSSVWSRTMLMFVDSTVMTSMRQTAHCISFGSDMPA